MRHSKETIEKIRQKAIGRKLSPETKKKMSDNHRTKNGYSSAMKGKKQSAFQKETVRNIAKGNQHAKGNKPNKTSFKKRHSPWNKNGAEYSDETRLKMSLAKRGEKSPTWKGGVYPEHLKIRKSSKYRNWRKAVLQRDLFQCIWCGETEGLLDVDHIKPFAKYPELRFDLKNGRTLCRKCHQKTKTYGKI